MTAATPPGDEQVRVTFLEGLRVLELGDGVAGAAAGGLLWALGADVVTVTDAGSPHRRAVPSVGGSSDRSLLSVVLDRGKKTVELDGPAEFEALFADSTFDVVLVDRIGGVRGALGALANLDAYAEFVSRHNRHAWVTISAFGLSGPRAADTATELTVAAAGGMLAAVRDQRTGQPLKLAGQQSLLNTGQAAALAVCHAVDLASTAGPTHLDVSAVEATVAMGPVLEVGGLLLATGSVGGAKRYGAPASFYECNDGLVRISAMEDHQWQGVVAAMGRPQWADDFATVEARIDGADEVDEKIAAWSRGRSKLDAESVLQANGVPATAVYSPQEILESPQLAHRRSIERLDVGDGRTASVVGLPFRVVTRSSSEEPQARRHSLRGLRVLEASRVLAVPLAGAILGALGADVTKLEDLPRLDMYRRRGPYIDGEAGMERSAYFALMNHSKRGEAFDVDEQRARLDALVAEADVVIENLGPKRARTIGLDATVALERNRELLAISSTGFGQDGPHARYRAYAYNLQAAGALGYLTRNSDGESAEIDIAWADLITAYSLATIVAAWAVGPAGNTGVGLDFAMADLVIAHFNDYLAAASLGDEGPVDRANDVCPYAPNGVYPTSDGWLAISVLGDGEYDSLVSTLGRPPALGPRFGRAAQRLELRAELDEQLGALTRNHQAATLAADLRAVGVCAERVAGPADLITDEQLVDRDFLTTVRHPSWGERKLVGIPWRPHGKPALLLGAPPELRAD